MLVKISILAPIGRSLAAKIIIEAVVGWKPVTVLHVLVIRSRQRWESGILSFRFHLKGRLIARGESL